ncbi:HDOD domain-containing protein [Salinimonas marina]|uniref:HDOD domain-containing protein n=1 Tax=Salinimonas marina TaxID=2785918 RepID=A0A7S9DW10_9ALTE|nr:helix-turn-helix domain-containing protein [Salinimonas marina]QPG04877.1 HDOD domain-containing protein [Salinimonas marina]
MQYKGLFWSAMVRAILSMRRDQGTVSMADADALASLPDLEAGLIDNVALHELLEALCPPAQRETLGRSLIGYFDFNKMGNLVVYATATEHIEAALTALVPRAEQVFHDAITRQTADDTHIELSWQASPYPLIDDLQSYFLLTLCRHLAGRQFDFAYTRGLPAKQQCLLAALSRSEWQSGARIAVGIDADWLQRPSFYHSQAMEKLLAPTLSRIETPGLKDTLLHIFAKAEAPARIRAEWAAQQMNQTESGLRRMLRAHNIAFSSVLKEYIHDKSCHRLLAGEKTEDTAVSLGFADRRSFERSFKEYAGISAGQLRQLGNRLRFQKGNHSLLDIVDNLPPLPATIQSLLQLDDDTMTLKSVVQLIQKDPIFQAHIMSKASKAIYGSSPDTLEQAIGRNLGLSNIKQLAVVFAAQQQLNAQCRHPDVEKLADAMLLSLPVFEALNTETETPVATTDTLKQLILFSTLSVFLVFHDKCLFVDGVMRAWDEAQTFSDFVSRLSQEFGVCLYGATSLMLLRWGFNSEINQTLWKLCQVAESQAAGGAAGQVLHAHNISFTLNAMGHESHPIVYDSMIPALAARIKSVISQWQ